MKKQHNSLRENDSLTIKSKKKLLYLSFIALGFSFSIFPLVLLGYIPVIGDVFWFILAFTFWGLFIQMIGVIIGIIAFCKGIIDLRNSRERKSMLGLIMALISIIFPIIWWCIIHLRYLQGEIELLI